MTDINLAGKFCDLPDPKPHHFLEEAIRLNSLVSILTSPDNAPANAKDAKVLLRRADDALYRAKEEGRNRVRSKE